jgi:hypothetical protein
MLDYIWEEWEKTGKWPRSRVVHHQFGKDEVEHAFRPLNDSYLLECEPSHDPTYEMRLYGAISMSRGDEWLGLLARFLECLRDAYNTDPGREANFMSEEIARQANLSLAETTNLGRLLSFHVLEMMNFGPGSAQFVGWQCGIPKGLDEIGQPGDQRRRLESMLARRYQPRCPSGLRIGSAPWRR